MALERFLAREAALVLVTASADDLDVGEDVSVGKLFRLFFLTELG